MNGYEKTHRLDIEARADMIETVAGYDEPRVMRALEYALGEAGHELRHTENDADDEADALRWVACLIERRLADLTTIPKEG